MTASCNPCSVEPAATSNLTATGTDPDGDPLTYQWTAPQGTFSNANAPNTVWTAPNQEGNVLGHGHGAGQPRLARPPAAST